MVAHVRVFKMVPIKTWELAAASMPRAEQTRGLVINIINLFRPASLDVVTNELWIEINRRMPKLSIFNA